MYQNFMPELVKILPPPAVPSDLDERYLEWNQQALSIKLPKDYVEFGRIYGSGNIKCAYSWEVISPFRASYAAFVLSQSRTHILFRESQQIEDVPFGIFPESGGILPFATSSNGDSIGWITNGEPDEWPVVDLETYEEGRYQILQMGFSEYFYRVLTRDIVLDRHEGGDEWEVGDVKFRDRFFFDKPLRAQ